MKNLEDIKKDRQLINSIDWDMTPEEAVRLYLEWGNNWSSGKYMIKSKDDIAHYFVFNTWGERPVVYLIRRNSEEASEIAAIDPPDDLVDNFFRRIKGVYAVEGEMREWLREQLDAV